VKFESNKIKHSYQITTYVNIKNIANLGENMLIDNLKKHMFANNLSIEDVSHSMCCSAGHLNRIIKGISPLSERFEWKITNYLELQGKIKDHSITKENKN